ncbi:TlpA family protein disulfide reductase [Acidithiobacillus thiooxidans]|uniref:TlpA family protein disulfide reductase n=1 Tax=Acidithiobacillus thiooxidans TaxID=930 RepID=UPI003563E8B8
MEILQRIFNAVLIAALFCSIPEQSCAKAVAKTTFLPQIVLTNLSGRKVDLNNLKGKVMVVNLWANWCPFCHEETPGFVRLHQNLGSKVRFVGIALDGKRSAEKFIDKEHVKYLTLLAGAHPSKVLSAIGDRNEMLPYTLIVDPDGRIVERHLGFFSASKLAMAINRVIRKYP